MRGRAFAVLMSSNVAMLTLGMIVAGRVTDMAGPRWVWGAAATASAISAVVGLVLAREAAKAEPRQAEPLAASAL
jgi:MFS family permease